MVGETEGGRPHDEGPIRVLDVLRSLAPDHGEQVLQRPAVPLVSLGVVEVEANRLAKRRHGTPDGPEVS